MYERKERLKRESKVKRYVHGMIINGALVRIMF